ncbi:hypothetical protein IE53DRAFT_317914 [Violaceomyces palustris]|uniref:Uncharacterized protein n=1 Tax=Violaceomyces palustris TaxID=1673888 RepID=A0ACD0NTW8_9BASI|nr:hypothetical protein IE53DRAFT_317914 [Violaceomyces palustris]
MPTRQDGRGIPVPRDQQAAGTRRAGQAGRRDQQAPWRSSLDLVWSYSRSQAFYGDNIATSPSFVDRHWAGNHGHGEIEEGDSIYEDGEGQSVYSEDLESFTETDADGEEADTYENEREGGFAAGALEWEGEQLPPNAVASRRRRASVRERSKARDRRLSRLEDEDSEERSRSRSRSPKRITAGKDAREPSNLRYGEFTSAAGDRLSQAEGASLRDPFAVPPDHDASEIKVTSPSENTPLLSGLKNRLSSASSVSRKARLAGTDRRLSGSGVSSSKSGMSIHGQGTSTFLQSWFNTVNALIGVGILALPLAFSLAGWLGGTVLFMICGALTNYTGKVLARIMWKEPSLRTYADIGSYAFGPQARLLVSLFFCLELWAVSVALIILFGDSMSAIFSSIPSAAFKAIGLAIVLPSVFLPLKFLSPISVIGIISTVTLFFVVLCDGLIKKEAPGSLFQPSPTNIGPQWKHVPLSFGLIMSGFSSHPVIPSLVKDMKDPRQFPRMLDLAYLAATVIYLGMGMIGYAMFGNTVSDEITRDLAKTAGFPHVLNKMAIWLIVINPLAKFALATRPIQTTFETLLGIDATVVRAPVNQKRSSAALSSKGLPSDGATPNGEASADRLQSIQGYGSVVANDPPAQASESLGPVAAATALEEEPPMAGSAISMRAARLSRSRSPRFKLLCRIALRVALTTLITATAIVLPGFEKVMAFLGAFLAFATCVFGPLLANLKLFQKEMKGWRVALDLVILAVSFVMAITGTVWAFLPR